MLTNLSRTQLITGTWLASVVAGITLSVMFGAHWSMTALIFVITAAPMGIALLLGFGAANPITAHDTLYETPVSNQRRS
jgi:fatty acid desaturase